MGSGEKQTGQNHDIADIEESAAKGDQLSLQGIQGKTGNGTGTGQAENGGIDREHRYVFTDLFSPPPEKKGGDTQQEEGGNQMYSAYWTQMGKETNIADMPGNKEAGTEQYAEFQTPVCCRVQA